MNEALARSRCFQIIQWMEGLLRALFSGSRVLRRLRTDFQSSALLLVCRRWLSGDSPVETSRWKRACDRGNHWLSNVRWMTAALNESLIGRLYGAVRTCGRESRLFSGLFEGGVTTILLTILGLYAGVDFFLRDVCSIPILSSLWDEVLLGFSLLWLIRIRMDRKNEMATRANTLDVFVFLFLGIGFALLNIVSPFFSIAVSGYRATVQYILWFFVVSRLIRDDRDFKRLYLVMLFFAAVIALHGIYQYIAAVPIPAHWTDQAEQTVRTRVYSIFGSPNIMGDYMVIFAPMAAGLAYHVKDKRWKLAAWFFTFVMCFSCLFTMSRGAWVALTVAIFVFALLVDRRLFIVILAAGVSACFLPFVASRIGYLFTPEFSHSTANGGRASRWALGLSYLYRVNPFFGFGLGMFGGAVAMQNQVYPTVSYFYLDNYYLKLLVEMGYLGLGAFLLLMLSFLSTSCRSLYRSAKRAADSMYPLCAGMTAGLCGVLVHCYFENIFEEPYMMATFWIIAAMIVYLGFFRKEPVK